VVTRRKAALLSTMVALAVVGALFADWSGRKLANRRNQRLQRPKNARAMNNEDNPKGHRQQADNPLRAAAQMRQGSGILEQVKSGTRHFQGRPPSYHLPTRPIEWLQVGINVVLAVIAIGALCIYNAQLIAMKGQQTVMQGQVEEMRTEQRAWIYLDPPKFLAPLTKNRNGVWDVHLQFPIHNVGHLPAMNVRVVNDSPMPTTNTGNTVADFKHHNCIDKGPEDSGNNGQTVFPNQEGVTIELSGGIWPEDIVAALARPTAIEPWVVGCLEYRIPNSPIPHFTRFAYIIRQDVDKTTDSLGPDPDSIPIDKLRLQPWSYKDSFAAD
jgi:hypothetical protein